MFHSVILFETVTISFFSTVQHPPHNDSLVGLNLYFYCSTSLIGSSSCVLTVTTLFFPPATDTFCPKKKKQNTEHFVALCILLCKLVVTENCPYYWLLEQIQFKKLDTVLVMTYLSLGSIPLINA